MVSLKDRLIIAVANEKLSKFTKKQNKPDHTAKPKQNKPNQNIQLSICITIKNRSKVIYNNKTIKLFPNCINSIKQSIDKDTTEIIISDWNSTDINMPELLKHELFNYNYKLISLRGKFSRGAGLNAAAKASTGSIIMFLDADMIITEKAVQNILKYTNTDSSYFPICYLYMDAEHKTHTFGKKGYGNCAIHRSNLIKWREKQSWGYEDNEYYNNIKTTKIRHKTKEIRHQWHPTELKHKYYKNTIQSLISDMNDPIAIVGNGKINSEHNIDNYSTIIRINNYIIKGFENFVGSRTDFWATSCWKDIEVRQNKALVPFHVSDKPAKNAKKFAKIHNIECIFSDSSIKEIPIKYKFHPTTGFALVYWIIKENKKVNLFGFDGFKSGHYWTNDKIKTKHIEASKEIEYLKNHRLVTFYE